MTKCRPISAVLLAVCIPALAAPLSLTDALQGALERDPQFLSERYAFEGDMAGAEEAGREFLPRASLRSTGVSSYNRYDGYRSDEKTTRGAATAAGLEIPSVAGGTVGIEVREGFSYTTTNYIDEMYAQDAAVTLKMRQPLLGGGTVLSGRMAATERSKPGALRAAATASLEEARNDAIIRAARLYYDVVEQRWRQDIAERRLAERRLRLEASAASAALRVGGESDLARERLDIREAELGLRAARQALQAQEAALGRILGDAPGELARSVPPLGASDDPARLERHAVTLSPRVRRADSLLGVRRADAAIAGWENAPALSLSVSLGTDYFTDDPVDRTLEQSFTQILPVLRLQVLLDLPLLRGRDRGLAVQAAASATAQAAAERDRARAEAEDAVSGLLAERERLRDLLALRGEQRSLSADQLRVRSELFASSRATASDVVFARLDVEERDLALWRARVDLFLVELGLAGESGEDLASLLLTPSPRASEAAP